MSDRPDAETSDNLQSQQEIDIHASDGIQTCDLRKRTAGQNCKLDPAATRRDYKKHLR
jgi:hypothetical protein